MEKRLNETVNRLNKTKEEKTIDFEAEKAARLATEKAHRRNEIERQKLELEQERKKKQEEAELKSYGSVFKSANMESNKDTSTRMDYKKYEEDFF